MSPLKSVAVLAFLYYFWRRFRLSPYRIPTTVRKVRGWYEKSVVRTVRKVQGRYEKSMVRIVHGTKSLQMVRNVYGTKSLWYEKSGSPWNQHCDTPRSARTEDAGSSSWKRLRSSQSGTRPRRWRSIQVLNLIVTNMRLPVPPNIIINVTN